MEKVNKNCQSCGMPLKKDSAGGGTNSGGKPLLKDNPTHEISFE